MEQGQVTWCGWRRARSLGADGGGAKSLGVDRGGPGHLMQMEEGQRESSKLTHHATTEFNFKRDGEALIMSTRRSRGGLKECNQERESSDAKKTKPERSRRSTNVTEISPCERVVRGKGSLRDRPKDQKEKLTGEESQSSTAASSGASDVEPSPKKDKERDLSDMVGPLMKKRGRAKKIMGDHIEVRPESEQNTSFGSQTSDEESLGKKPKKSRIIPQKLKERPEDVVEEEVGNLRDTKKGGKSEKKRPKVKVDDKEQRTCLHCKEEFETALVMRRHLMTAHHRVWTPANPEGVFNMSRVFRILGKLACLKCGKETRHPQYYKFHADWCGREHETMTCELCGHVIKTMYLSQHMRHSHTPKTPKGKEKQPAKEAVEEEVCLTPLGRVRRKAATKPHSQEVELERPHSQEVELERPHSGSGAGEATLSGSGAGEATLSGSGAGEATLSRSGAGEATLSGSGAGEATLSGSGAGEATLSRSGAGEATLSRKWSWRGHTLQKEVELERPHSQEVELERPHSQEVELERPHSQEVELVRPHSQEVELERPHSQEVELERPHSQEVELERPHSPEVELERPHSQEVELERPHSQEVELERPYSQEVELERPHSQEVEDWGRGHTLLRPHSQEGGAGEATLSESGAGEATLSRKWSWRGHTLQKVELERPHSQEVELERPHSQEVELERPHSQEANTTQHKTGTHMEPSGQRGG
ncbi:hypothetical protein LSAT2_023823 [Lamellibrachia satsuma]|nr:hypothetical protein LSAT2_023823 [Lamellibrachia satsuma]